MLTLRPAARPLSPALRWRMRADTRRVLSELKHRVETGHPAPAMLAPSAAKEAQLGGPLQPRSRREQPGSGPA